MEDYALLGGGGLAIEITEYMLTEGYHLCGYYAPEESKDCSALIPYLGDERKRCSNKVRYLIGAGLIGLRKKMIGFMEANELVAGTFVSKRAYVSSSARLGKGAVIAPFAMVAGNPEIGDYLLANCFSNIGHDVHVGNNVVVGPGARINGGCRVGNHVTLGANAALIPGSVLADDSEIGILTYPRRRVEERQMILAMPGRMIGKD